MQSSEISIIVPCYNEYRRLPKFAYISFLKNNKEASICFINDCSTDKTAFLLEEIKTLFPDQIFIITNKTNIGKAASVRQGALFCYQHKTANHLAYLDADLATSLEECFSYLEYLKKGKKFVFASRILKIGSVVERKFSRFVFGRIIATFISSILGIKVYDTQCGCKVFNVELSNLLFEKPFISKWLFDVELFSRMLCHYKKEKALEIMDEIPVKKWIDIGDSKVKLSYAFKLWIDLFKIRRMHNKNYSS